MTDGVGVFRTTRNIRSREIPSTSALPHLSTCRWVVSTKKNPDARFVEPINTFEHRNREAINQVIEILFVVLHYKAAIRVHREGFG